MTNEILAVRLGEGGAVRLKDRFLDDFHVKRIIDHTWEWIWNLCYKNNTVLQQNPLKTYDNHHEKKKNHVWRQFIPKKLIRQRVQVKTLLVLLKVSIQNVMPSITTNLWLTNRKFTKLLRDCFKYCFNPAYKILLSLVFWRKIDFIWGVFVLVFVF